VHSSVEGWLPAAGLPMGKTNRTSRTLKDSHYGFSRFWIQCVDDTRYKQLNIIAHNLPQQLKSVLAVMDIPTIVNRTPKWRKFRYYQLRILEIL